GAAEGDGQSARHVSGRRSASRVLSGRIRRGDSETIVAAILLSDMRGFTALANRVSARRLVDVLNCCFELHTSVIAARGGEVLKFMGDGVLEIFPVDAAR